MNKFHRSYFINEEIYKISKAHFDLSLDGLDTRLFNSYRDITDYDRKMKKVLEDLKILEEVLVKIKNKEGQYGRFKNDSEDQ